MCFDENILSKQKIYEESVLFAESWKKTIDFVWDHLIVFEKEVRESSFRYITRIEFVFNLLKVNLKNIDDRTTRNKKREHVRITKILQSNIIDKD